MSFISVSPLTLILGSVVVALACVVLFIRMRSRAGSNSTENLKTLPGPRGLPLLGSSVYVGTFGVNPWPAFSQMRRVYGDIYGVTLGSRECVVISNWSMIRDVLIQRPCDFANRPDFLRFHAIFRGNRNLSIALCDWSDKQKVRRDKAFPYMHPKVCTYDGDRMNNIITQEMQQLVATLRNVLDQPYEARQSINVTCANIFYQYICSVRFQEDDKDFLNVVDIYDKTFQELFRGFAIDVMPWLKTFYFRRLNNLRKNAETVSKLTERLVEEHYQDIDYDSPRDLIDTYLIHQKQNEGNAERSVTREDIEVITEDLIGGHPVLGNLWLWGLYLLAANPGVRRNIREEVSRITSGNRAPSGEDRKFMPYTDATCYEILRVVTSPVIPHVATTDTKIEGYEIKKDSMIMFNTYDMNMDPQLWTEPRRFNPSRFLDSSGNVSKPDFFIPFGTGKRSCLGDGLVKSTLLLGLATLLQNFDITLPEGFPQPDMYDIPGLVVPKREIILVFRQLNADQSTTIRIS